MATTEQDTSKFETDQFLQLLTDALRAGPGSPQWHEAVVRLKSANPGEADEYQMLLRAREDLAAGREYRSIRAGAGFTRKVMDQIDAEAASSGKGAPSANLLAILGAVAVLAAVVVVGIIIGRQPPAGATLEDLSRTFTTPTANAQFAQGIPAQWKPYGVMPVYSTRELGLRGALGTTPGNVSPGGLFLARPMPADKPFSVEAKLRMSQPSANAVVRLFIADDPNFASGGKPPFVVELKEGALSVFSPTSKILGQQSRPPEKTAFGIQIKMVGALVIVESDGKRLFAGEHGLTPGAVRYPGLGFMTRGDERTAEEVVVEALRVMEP